MLRKHILYLCYLKYKIKFYNKVKFNGFTIIYNFKKSRIIIGDNTSINSGFFSNLLGLYQKTIIISRYGGIINIGKNVGVSGATIYAMSKISIGNNTMIGANCKIIDNDFHPLNSNKRILNNPEDIKKREISIGNNCFIGMNTIILKGTIIGDNSIVGAGSVVSGKFKSDSIICGNPAVKIKDNTN